MSATKKKLCLTAIFVEEANGFTAFFAQFPNVIAEGNTKDDAISNLFELLSKVFEHLKEEEVDTTNAELKDSDSKVTTKSFEMLATA